jgi:hypothetical protein
MRQRTFSFVFHFSGSDCSEQTPVPSGPRHAGQFPPFAQIQSQTPKPTPKRKADEVFITIGDVYHS